jgi:hypothetical protein
MPQRVRRVQTVKSVGVTALVICTTAVKLVGPMPPGTVRVAPTLNVSVPEALKCPMPPEVIGPEFALHSVKLETWYPPGEDATDGDGKLTV